MKQQMARLRHGIQQLGLRAGVRIERLTAQERADLAADPPAPPPEVAARLRGDHPRLQVLRAAYAASGLPAVTSSVWDEEHVDADVALDRFRADNMYVWQQRQLGASIRVKQYLLYRDVADRDELDLLSRCHEDGAFGATTFTYAGCPPISRDLVDSVNELNLLDRQLDLRARPGLRVLDIGAGYGRLAHRAATGLDGLGRWDCVDAVPASTFLCEFYLRHRGVDDRCRAVPLTEVEGLAGPYDLAVNVHSFPEMPLVAIRWWLDQVDRLAIPHLFVVPNHQDQVWSHEADGTQEDVRPELEARGFRLAHAEPVVATPAIRELTRVHDHFLWFTRA